MAEIPEIVRPRTLTSKDQRDIAVKASERNPALKREEHVGTVLAHFNYQDTTDVFKANLAALKGLAMNGFDTTPLIYVLEAYGKLSTDRQGAGRIITRDILAPPKVFIPGLGIPPEEEPEGILSRIGGFFGRFLPGGGS